MTESLPLTPSQTAGPYLKIGMLGTTVDPSVVDPSDPRAIVVSGVLLDGAGDPVPDGMIESWQANAAGRYASPEDDRDDPQVEEGFTGFCRSGTEDEGRFELTVVKPGRVPWPAGGTQAPHLEIGVFARGLLKRLATRMYFPDEVEANATDPVLMALDDVQRASLIAEASGGGLRFDIVLQGQNQTTFFAM